MEFVVLDDAGKRKYFDEMLSLMELSDKEFVPPLSFRGSTAQKNLKGNDGTGNGVLAYLSEMQQQRIPTVIEEDKLLGYVSYKENYTNDIILSDTLPNIYLSTLILSPSERGRVLTKQMYNHLFFYLYGGRNVFTRTWSTNNAHTELINFFDFEETARLAGDRGNGIDTVYFGRSRYKA